MRKPKQQVISRFFAPKQNPPSSPPPKPSPPPKISATVSFTPSKRKQALALASLSPNKHPKTLIPNPNPNPLSKSSKSLHQKFLQKLLDPPPQNPNPNPTANPKYTPLEQQVVDLKANHPDVLLMVEVGYRYRFFGPDADTAARILGIVAHVDHNFLTASIPSFRLHFHVRRLVSAGYKVGVVRQTETAAIKAHGSNKLGPFTRGLSALYTKATVEAAEEMGGGDGDLRGNYLLCVVEKEVSTGGRECGVECSFDVKVGMVGVEISTGDVMYGEFDDGVMRADLEAVVLSLAPVEILMGEPLSRQTEKLLLDYAGPSSNVRVERTSRDCFKDGGALADVMSLYEDIGEDSLILEHNELTTEVMKVGNHLHGIEGIMAMPELAVQALALTIRYLKQFGFERILCLGASFRPFSSNSEMTLSANTLQQLEILKNNFDGSENGSLLQSMNHTHTAFGSRLLRHWVSHPLRDRNLISARLDAVSEIADSMGPSRIAHHVVEFEEEAACSPVVQRKIDYLLSSALTTLGRSPDVQRGITRIFHRTATAAEFIAVIHAILVAGKQLQQLSLENDSSGRQEKTVQSPLLRRLILTASSSTAIGDASKLLSALDKDAAAQGDLQNLFVVSNGQFPEVARGRTAVQMAKEKLDLLIGQYRKQLGMRNLEFMSVSGSTHLIELSSDVKVPSSWVKVNSTKKTTRYHPTEVLTALDELSLATEELTIACRATWDTFLIGFGKYYAEFQAAVQALAALDCLHSLAILSRSENYVRPVFVDDVEPAQIHICSGRHPVLDSILQNNFVPNDTNLHADGEYCQIITGPNMGGKSCYIRQVALIAIMAQVGSFVPASSAKLHVLDGIYTRMGSSDSIQQGTSTFLEELNEASNVLNNCTSHSLVIIDELGRGTSTHDGVAIAYATLHHLVAQKKMHGPFCYPITLKIIDIKEEFPGSVMSDKSFGLNVARLAQLPPACIDRAAVMAAKLEAEVNARAGNQLGQRLSGKTDFFEENLSLEKHFDPSEFSPRKELVALSVDQGHYDDLARAYLELFSLLQSAFGVADPTNSIQSLKDAKQLAMKMLSR
ncbi:DNA mismatch repair protein MSH3 [Cinnamomum micranthum f. kanehirae]|uniref:DNA mismatch repair protein MSH3 n=1 Tax=Cinnamomum micranthum f. kanehirae TaxID=337451 RepID=A0A443PMB4_9MAGN|nr:DNA mismatch repair protein MSH3 [Cinnamomum micranthum f. kanehirae]